MMGGRDRRGAGYGEPPVEGMGYGSPGVPPSYGPPEASGGDLPRASASPTPSENFLRLRGLPLSANEIDIMNFFSLVGVTPVGVQLVLNAGGRPTGDAFVQLGTFEDLRVGSTRHLQTMGGKVVEVTPCSTQEVVKTLGYEQRGPNPSAPSSFPPAPASAAPNYPPLHSAGSRGALGGPPYGSSAQSPYAGGPYDDPASHYGDVSRKRMRY